MIASLPCPSGTADDDRDGAQLWFTEPNGVTQTIIHEYLSEVGHCYAIFPAGLFNRGPPADPTRALS